MKFEGIDLQMIKDFIKENENPVKIKNTQKTNYSKIRFTKVMNLLDGVLPKQCEIKCWNDMNYFSTPPVSIPVSHKDGKYLTKGCFCSFECAKTYLCNNLTEFSMESSMLLQSCKDKEVKSTELINTTYTWKNLKEFGGDIDLDTLRGKCTPRKVYKTPSVSYPREYVVCTSDYEIEN